MENLLKHKLEIELQELQAKTNKLESYLESPAYQSLTIKNQVLLKHQYETMSKYESILYHRIRILD